jgi:hypothetical protein
VKRIPRAIARLGAAALAAVAFGSWPAGADDGSWSSSFRESGGPIYAQAPNADIALEAEILRFSMRPQGLAQALFRFRNTSSERLEVEAGFPIKASLGLEEATVGGVEVYALVQGGYEPEPQRGLAEARGFFGDAISFDENYESADGREKGAWLIRADAAATRRTLARGDFEDPFSFSIVQDGRRIEWDYAVLDPTVEKTDRGVFITLEFHFHHTLLFKPSSSSIVDIVYTQDTLRGQEPTGAVPVDRHGWDYVLGTGGTWKGPIGKLLLCLPEDAAPTLPEAFQPLGINGRERVFLARDYRPAPADRISLELVARGAPSPYYLEQIWFGDPVAAKRPTAPAQDFVKLRGASSFLGDRTTVYTPGGVIKDMDFQPLRLVDGVLESSWVEGAKGDGVGEWVELELARGIAGVEIQNGFSMSLTPIPGKGIDGYYEKNNRVKELLYESKDGKARGRLELEDTNDHLQPFPLALPKGVYRFTIGSVYKGSKWADTCLGEIVFLPASEALAELLAGDDFLRRHFLMDHPAIGDQ